MLQSILMSRKSFFHATVRRVPPLPLYYPDKCNNGRLMSSGVVTLTGLMGQQAQKGERQVNKWCSKGLIIYTESSNDESTSANHRKGKESLLSISLSKSLCVHFPDFKGTFMRCVSL